MASVELTVDALIAFLRRLDAHLTPAQHELARRREATRIGIAVDAWLAAHDAPLDLSLVQRLHVGITGARAHVRRTLRDGQYTIAPSQPGKLRTKPQALRLGDHVEPAWEQGDLKRGLIALLRTAGPMSATTVIRQAARLVCELSRAQPFTGSNEQVALAFAACSLRRAGLPAVPATAIARDPAFTVALREGLRDEPSGLERYLSQAVWDEALAFAEWIAPVPPPAPERWTLADEHRVLQADRARAVRIEVGDLEAFAGHASEVLVRALTPHLPVEPGRTRALDTHAARLQETWNSATRGRAICPHEPILIVSGVVARDLGLELKLILGSAGRGLSGAVSVQVALELADQPGRSAPALLLLPDERADDRRERFARWIPTAIPALIASAPLRT